MRSSFKRRALQTGAALLAAALLFVANSPASASIVVVVSDSNGDPSVSSAPQPNGGPFTFSGSIGSYTFSATVTATPLLVNPPNSGQLDVSFSGTSGGGAGGTGTLTITTYQTMYTTPASAASAASSVSIGGTINGNSATTKAFYDPTDVGTTSMPPDTLLQSLTFTTSSFSGGSSVTISPFIQPYALVSQISMNFSSAGGNISGDQDITVTTPAPAGLVLALTGLPCLAMGSWIRRRLKIA